MDNVRTGLERLAMERPASLAKARFGLLANQASVGPHYEHAIDIIDGAFPGRLKKLFGPQHGFAGEKQDNMVESSHRYDGDSGRRIYSLYGDTRKPDPEWFQDLDVLLVDLVDVGTRVYTFATTLSYCLETAAEVGLKVVVLDRPNPIGGMESEGNLLKTDCASFVGRFPIPMRHGLTIGELALFIAGYLEKPPDLSVMKLDGWEPEMYFSDTGLPWVMPSPNMPAWETAWLYPGQVLWEGTNVSEGRGTTRPFHLCGAPFIDSRLITREMNDRDLQGAYFRPAVFEPTFHKYRGQVCHGIEIHPVDFRLFKPYLTSLTLLEIIMKHYPEEFGWKPPPYEYEYERMPIDLIFGDRTVRQGLENGLTAEDMESYWLPELERFREERERYLLY